MDEFQKLLKTHAPLIMGIVNTTPDSFSDGGKFNTTELAVKHARQLVEEGAHIIDIGGESTRPNADIVTVKEELERVMPVIKELKGCNVLISIDTRNARTMEKAIEAGAHIINDVSALSHDENSLNIAAQSGLPVCLMHMQGTPKTMQENPEYNNIINEIVEYFKVRSGAFLDSGGKEANIILDPGIGFGKTLEHNLEIFRNIDKFKSLSYPILIGSSRKSFIHAIDSASNPLDRIGGSLASALISVSNGADILRVHDVKQTVQAIKVANAINKS